MNDVAKFILRAAGTAAITVLVIKGLNIAESKLKEALREEQSKKGGM